MPEYDKQYHIACIILRRGERLSLTRIAYLLSIGVDVSALEAAHAP